MCTLWECDPTVAIEGSHDVRLPKLPAMKESERTFMNRGSVQGQRDEIARLAVTLAETIEEVVDRDTFEALQEIRQLSKVRRNGRPEPDQRLGQLLESLNQDQLRVIVRAFSILLDLVNLTEDRQRLHVLRQRARDAYPNAYKESIEDAVQQLKKVGKSAAEIQNLLDDLQIELVFTAHPTEAKRRSVRAKLRKIRGLLNESDSHQLTAEESQNWKMIRGELLKLWLTDFIRPWRPTVLQEVQRGLSIKPVLWQMTPDILNEIRTALAKEYPDDEFRVRPVLTFGSWIGGDRDGHPYVTAAVTEQTLIWLRQAAIEFHLSACRDLFDSLSLSKRQTPVGVELESRLAEASRAWPNLRSDLGRIPPNEVVRRWLRVIEWRLEQTLRITLDHFTVVGSYSSAKELESDVALIYDAAIVLAHGETLLADEVSSWIDQIRIFGFHLVRLDVRQDSRQYRSVMNELLERAGLCHDGASLNEKGRQQLLADTLQSPLDLQSDELSDSARETLSLFELLWRVIRAFGKESLGGHVVSMTHTPSDIMTVLWFWQHVHRDQGDDMTGSLVPIPLVPLFETIDDLERAPEIFRGLLAMSAYRDYLRRQDNRQMVMLGYSDSTKDGGYLSACWSLNRAQIKLHELAEQEGIHLTFFHGRGGSLGRGGGPAARGILSLPPVTFHGSMRLTEQGEVLSDRYDDPHIAHRHLEQVIWSSMLASGLPAVDLPDEWPAMMQRLARTSFEAYRQLVEQPGFVDFFRRATPISEIEQLPIGSRPSRRRGGHSLSDLRAIPWVFSWTQARCLVPAWYGIGSAVTPVLEDANGKEMLQKMYREWPFFRATMDNAELALAKTDVDIALRYAELANDSQMLKRIGDMIGQEFSRSRHSVLSIMGNQELLDGIPWLQDSIHFRNRYIDPLNLIQIGLLRRVQEQDWSKLSENEEEELRHLLRLTIKGLAAGMRTSG
jgi:phosphoenolpyruvate carboxylase